MVSVFVNEIKNRPAKKEALETTRFLLLPNRALRWLSQYLRRLKQLARNAKPSKMIVQQQVVVRQIDPVDHIPQLIVSRASAIFPDAEQVRISPLQGS